MAVLIESSYGKTVGLPGYSSHKFTLSIKTEVSDLSRIGAEAQRVYDLLQQAVDEQIIRPGFVPGSAGNNGNGTYPANGKHASSNGSGGDPWNCSDKQKELILKIVAENNLDKNEVNELARLRFGMEVKQLNKLSASGLIDELLEKYGGGLSDGRRSGPRPRKRYAERGSR